MLRGETERTAGGQADTQRRRKGGARSGAGREHVAAASEAAASRGVERRAAARQQRAPRHAHKVHVEEEINANVAKVEEIGDQAPQLAARNRAPAVVQLKWREDVQRTQGRQQKRARKVHARNDRQLKVPVEQVDLHAAGEVKMPWRE